MAIGAWGATIGLGIAIGPIAGGLVTGPVLVGLHLFGERPDRHRGLRGGGPFGTRLEESGSGPAGPGRCSSLDRRVRPLALGRYRRSHEGLDFPGVVLAGSASLRGARSLCGLGIPLHASDAQAHLLFGPALRRRGGSRVPRGLWPPGRAVPPDAVSPVRSRNCPLQAGARILPMAGTLVVSAVLSPSSLASSESS